MDYEVRLEIFEGPLDLLLHLIHKNEVDIFDIPVALITDQYLEYLDLMKALNINLAGDFLVMASTLIHIKSKMLLPGFNEEDEEEDPRMELTRPLLEYMQFKELAEDLSGRDVLDRDVFSRKVPADFQIQIEGEEPHLDVNLFQLMDAFRRIMDERLPGVQLKFRLERWSVKEKTELIMTQLRDRGPVFFQDLFDEDRTVSEFIVTFLALLELVHAGLVKVFQPAHESDIRLVPCFDENGENSHAEIP
jgi:segregation and condensation protein A